MLEIILIFLFCQRNIRHAELRGKDKGSAIGWTIFFWIFFEIIGIILGWMLIKEANYPDYGVLYMSMLGIGCGLIGAYIAYRISIQGPILGEKIPHDPIVYEFSSYEKTQKPCRIILHRDRDYSLTTGNLYFTLNGEHICSLRQESICTCQTFMRKNVLLANKKNKKFNTYPYTFIVPDDGEMHIYFNGLEFNHKKTYISKGQIIKPAYQSELPPIPSAHQTPVEVHSPATLVTPPPVKSSPQRYEYINQDNQTKAPRFCQYCGRPRNGADKFCRFCGASLAM